MDEQKVVQVRVLPLPDAVREVLSEYRRIVDGNTTPEYDARRAVAFDGDGLYGAWGEVLETAQRMGFSVDDEDEDNLPFIEALVNGCRGYQHELRRTYPQAIDGIKR